MRSEEVVEEALGSPVKIRLLRVLKKPGSGFMTIRQLGRLTSFNPVTLSRALQSLRALGLVDYVQAGRAQLWRLVPGYAHYVLSPLLEAVSAVPSLPNALRERIAQVDQKGLIPPEVREMILYGSAATEEATVGSDVDLCVLLERTPRSLKVEEFFDRLRQEFFETFGMRVSILPVERRRFPLLKEPLKTNIRNGVVLYEKSPKPGS